MSGRRNKRETRAELQNQQEILSYSKWPIQEVSVIP